MQHQQTLVVLEEPPSILIEFLLACHYAQLQSEQGLWMILVDHPLDLNDCSNDQLVLLYPYVYAL